MSGRVSYLGGIVKDGLILDLDAGKLDSYNRLGTTWNDVSGNGNNGTLINFDSNRWDSNNGGRIIFDGVDSYIETSYNLGTVTRQTISCWINKTNTQLSLILAKSTLYYGLEIYPTTIYVNVSNDQYGYVNYNVNGWQNITFTYDGTQSGNINRLKIYLNGVNQSLTFVGTIPSSVSVSDVIQIGRRWWSPIYSQGSVSNVQIYNRVLLDSEVLQNYNALKGRYI